MSVDEMKNALRGICGIALTPFKENGDLNDAMLRKHLRNMVNKGINSENGTLVVGGSTGECGGMTTDERKRVFDVALDEIGGEVPVIAGCNHSCTRDAIDLIRHAQKSGAKAAMVLAPYYYVPSDETVVNFFKEIADHSDLPIMLYNNFEVTHKDVGIDTLARLVGTTTVVGIKECTPNFVKMEAVVRALGDKMTIVNGHGEFLEPFAAVAGTEGFISSTANFAPELAVDIWKARSAGDFVAAKKLRDRLSPYLDLAGRHGSQGGEPIVLSIIKTASNIVSGTGGHGRIPLPVLSEDVVHEIETMLKKVQLI